MFGLQKQRRNAAGSGAWFIAGHLTVFAKLSHHAVPLESRIFSSRCFSFSVPPFHPFELFVVPPSADSERLSPLPVYVRRRQAHLSRMFAASARISRCSLWKNRSGCERISRVNLRDGGSANLAARTKRCRNSCVQAS